MDAAGADLLVRLLATTRSVERVVVVRPDSHGYRWYLSHLPALRSPGARVLEFWRAPHAGTAPNSRPETFHAKMALADRELAYVGSSNFMVSSLQESLECGVLVRGAPARVFAAVVDAVLAVSTAVVPD